MTVESERNAYAVYKNGRIEFQFEKKKVDNESKVRIMHKKAGTEVGCTTVTKTSESKVCGIDKTSSQIELRSAPMTPTSEIKVCGMHKKSKMEVGCATVTVVSERKVYPIHKKHR